MSLIISQKMTGGVRGKVEDGSGIATSVSVGRKCPGSRDTGTHVRAAGQLQIDRLSHCPRELYKATALATQAT